MLPRSFLATTLFALSLAYPHSAKADPIELEAAGLIGAATSPGWVANPYALGFGARAGGSFYGVYAGISATYYLGGSFFGSGFHSLLAGAELGYTFKLGRLRLRPQVGVGDGNFSQQASDGVLNPPMTTTVSNVYVQPGAVFMIPMGPLFIGADAGAILLPHFTLATPMNDPVPVPARTYGSFTAHGQVGFFF